MCIKKVSFHFFMLLCLFLSFSSFSQVSLNGTVDVNDYAGMQPGLVEGISSVPAAENPLIRHLYMVSPDILAIVVDEQAIIESNLKPYHKQPQDSLKMVGYHGLSKLLLRKGDPFGYLCGWENNWYRPFNEITGKKLDLNWISRPSNFMISSPDDPNYGSAVHPEKIYRKSMPDESVHINLNAQSTLRHYIYLKLPAGLSSGKSYEITFSDNSPFKEDLSFRFDDRKLRSEAIHANLYGYEPEDEKMAFLSSWMGDGGALEFPGEMQFRIIDLSGNRTVYTGNPELKQPADEPEYVINGKAYNHNQTHIYSMDFSSLRKEGNYKLVVDGIGCSFDFRIDNNIWENTMRLLMKGFLHQRAGIELGPPYTNYIRPRNMHPDDGHTIYKCDTEIFFNPPGDTEGGGQSSIFERMQASILEDTSVPEAWGGWMDAGDFDRRMSHLYSVRRMMHLYEINPEYFERIDFNIPESSNNIPDILDEALWCLDLFRRTQGVYDKGGISWWIESIEHPRQGEPSWLNSLPTALCPPTPRANIHYAATAAHMARILREYDRELADKYEQSTLSAMKWVKNHPDVPDIFGRKNRKVIESLAYINLFRLTGEENWHQLFLDNMEDLYPDEIAGNLEYRNSEPVAIYALMKKNLVKNEIREKCRRGVVSLADGLLEGAREVTYDILREKNDDLSRLVTMRSKVLPVVMAHRINGDEKYIKALGKTIQYTMGANPMNRSFISGLGERCYMPYHHDFETDGLHVPAGIPNFGPTSQSEEEWGWAGPWAVDRIENAGLYPDKLTSWPMTEKCFNRMWIAPVNEFTVRSPMGELLMLTGYLAQF